MVDWTSPAEIARESLASNKLHHTLLGLYVWECVTSLDFDWQFITKKRGFQWALIFYFLNRYFMLFSVIGVIIGLNVTSPINCQPLYTFTVVIGAISIGLSSINLSLRTMGVWSGRLYIVVPLVVIILGHYALLLQVATLTATWIDGKGCVITYIDNPMLMATFIYTMSFDFILLTLTAVKLFMSTTGSRYRLRKLVFKDGLIYFIIAFLSNAVATTFILLDLNPVMSVIANTPAAVLTSIVACRVVRQLHNYSGWGTSSSITQCSSMAFSASQLRSDVSTMVLKDGDHIQMDTFSSSVSEAKTALVQFADIDQVERNDGYDPQSIHGKYA